MSCISSAASHHNAGCNMHVTTSSRQCWGPCGFSGFDHAGRGMLLVLHSFLGILSQTAMDA